MFVENTDAGAGGEELHQEAEEGVEEVPGGGAPVLTKNILKSYRELNLVYIG